MKLRPYTLAEARFILSHVYCVAHVPDDGGWVYPWRQGAGEALCCRCSCRNVADLRLHVVTEAVAAEWLKKENEAIRIAIDSTVIRS